MNKPAIQPFRITLTAAEAAETELALAVVISCLTSEDRTAPLRRAQEAFGEALRRAGARKTADDEWVY